MTPNLAAALENCCTRWACRASASLLPPLLTCDHPIDSPCTPSICVGKDLIRWGLREAMLSKFCALKVHTAPSLIEPATSISYQPKLHLHFAPLHTCVQKSSRCSSLTFQRLLDEMVVSLARSNLCKARLLLQSRSRRLRARPASDILSRWTGCRQRRGGMQSPTLRQVAVRP